MQDMLEEIGSRLSGQVQYGQIPDEPNNITVLNFYGGNTPRRAIGTAKPVIREPQMQVRVRNDSYAQSISLIEQHINTIERISGILGNKIITKITQIGDVIPLGRDDKNRYEFTVNFTIQIDNKEV